MQIYMSKKLQISDVFSGLKSRMGLCLLLRNNNNDNNNNNLHPNPQLYTLLKTLLGFFLLFCHMLRKTLTQFLMIIK